MVQRCATQVMECNFRSRSVHRKIDDVDGDSSVALFLSSPCPEGLPKAVQCSRGSRGCSMFEAYMLPVLSSYTPHINTRQCNGVDEGVNSRRSPLPRIS